MRAKLVVFFLTGVSFLGFSQKTFDVKWGKEFSAPRNSTVADIVGYDASGFYVVKRDIRTGWFQQSNLSLDKFDTEMNPVKSIELELTEQGRKTFIEYIAHLNGQLLLFTSFPDQRSKRNQLFLQTISKETLLPIQKEKKKIAEIDFHGKSKRNSGSFNFLLSPDSSKILISYDMPYTFGEPEKFGFIVMDNQTNVLWTKEVTLPYRDELFDIQFGKVDNFGNAYLLGKQYKEVRKEKRRGSANFQYKILAYTEQGEVKKEYSVSLPDKFLTDMQIGIRPNKDIVCAGFYSDNGTFSIKGTYFLSVDAVSGEIKTKSFKDFGIDFITQNMTERAADRAQRRQDRGQDVELYEYDLDKLILRSDGGALLIGEQYFVRTVTQTTYSGNRSTTYTNTHYYYNDIIVVNLAPSGNIDWAVKVPKRQHTINDGGFYSSYAMALNKDKIYFVYNDNPDNLGYSGQGNVKALNQRNQMVTVAQINTKGEMKRQPLSSGISEVIIRPKVCEQISYSQMLLFGQRRKTQQFGLILF
jgi:hypothetical protein